jgi:hypothetical protein
MEDPDLIATLIPADKWEFARNAFKLPENKARHLAPTRGFAQGPTISSREPTPAPGESSEDGCEYDKKRNN